MKNTKEITTGAMLLAIYGALLLLDRQFSYFLIEIIALAVPILIIMFGNMYNYKDAIYFSLAILFLALIISPNPYSYFYIPVGIIVGNAYNFMLYRNVRSKLIMLIITLIFAVADLAYIYTISPLFLGYGFNDLVKESSELIDMLLKVMPVELSIDTTKFVTTITYASLLLTSVMEGLITHILVSFLFRRFRINKASFNINGMMVLNPIPAYILIACAALCFIAFRVDNDLASSIMFVVGAISMYILAYYGYIYLIMITRIRMQRNMTFLIILAIIFLLPISLLILMFIGFLYGAGPLKKYLVPPQGGAQ